MNDLLTCIMCPLGCELEVKIQGEQAEVAGNKCEKGIEFAIEEILSPQRNLATSVPIDGKHYKTLSVRLSQRVPRHQLFPILKEIATLRPMPPIKCEQILIKNVLGTNSDVIATRTVI